MIRRWLALTYYLYALRLAALSHSTACLASAEWEFDLAMQTIRQPENWITLFSGCLNIY